MKRVISSTFFFFFCQVEADWKDFLSHSNVIFHDWNIIFVPVVRWNGWQGEGTLRNKWIGVFIVKARPYYWNDTLVNLVDWHIILVVLVTQAKVMASKKKASSLEVELSLSKTLSKFIWTKKRPAPFITGDRFTNPRSTRRTNFERLER